MAKNRRFWPPQNLNMRYDFKKIVPHTAKTEGFGLIKITLMRYDFIKNRTS